MVFSDSYDKSLFLLLKYDKEDREKIKKFINDIPREMYIDINKKFDYISDSSKIFDNNELCGYFNRDNVQFYYRINLCDKSLNIGYNLISDIKEYSDEFEINLYPCNDLLNMTKNNCIYVAMIRPFKYAFNYGKAKRLWVYGGFLSESRLRFVSLESSYRNIINSGIINTNNISDNISLEDVNNFKGLVKKKK